MELTNWGELVTLCFNPSGSGSRMFVDLSRRGTRVRQR
jgi:hypothetical protein